MAGNLYYEHFFIFNNLHVEYRSVIVQYSDYCPRLGIRDLNKKLNLWIHKVKDQSEQWSKLSILNLRTLHT